jgi:hypothetical protein
MLKRSHRYAVPLLLASLINSLAIYQVEARKLEEADARLINLLENLTRQRPAPTPTNAAPFSGSTPGCARDHQDFTPDEAREADPN